MVRTEHKNKDDVGFLVGSSVRRPWSNLRVNEDAPLQKTFSKMKVSDIDRHRNVDRLHHQQSHTARKVKGVLQGRRATDTRWEPDCSQRDEGQQNGNRTG